MSGNATRNQRESVKPGSTVGTTPAPGSSLADPLGDRVHERRLHRRAVAEDLVVERERVAVVAEHLDDAARARPRAPRPGRDAAVDRTRSRATG